MTPEQAQEITRLRSLNLSPKQIARNLGLRPAEVSEYIRKQAEATTLAREERGEMVPLERCLVNESAYRHFFETGPRGWFRKGSSDGGEGMAQVIVVRQERNRHLVASYLIDYWCLGVKNALGPRRLDQTKYELFIGTTFEGFQEDAREITLEQAQAIIFNAIDYAAKLGFNPHKDFAEAKQLLGPRIENLPALQARFGKDGKPFYVSGPYDNPTKIIATLEQNVGEGNFDFMIQMGPM